MAIALDDASREKLAGVLADLPRSAGLRWAAAHQLHLTLKFLGECPETRVPDVCRVMSEAASRLAPFELELGGVGAFGERRAPRVLWCGAQDRSDGCRRWLAAADAGLEPLGFPRELREFHAHVTLARAKSPRGAALLAHWLADPPASLRDFRHTLVAREVLLYESLLGSGGAQYAVVGRASLTE